MVYILKRTINSPIRNRLAIIIYAKCNKRLAMIASLFIT